MPPHRPTKKEIEQWQVSRLAEAYPDFPRGQVRPDERPDFLVEGQIVVGVELTQLFRDAAPDGTRLQEQERLREEIADIAATQYDAQKAPPVDVAVHFSGSARLSKRHKLSLAQRLAALVMHYLPEADCTAEVEYDWENRAIVPEEIAHVRIARFARRPWSLWRPMSAGFVPQLDPLQLQGAIDRKCQDYTAHLRKCEASWLVLVADGFGISSTFTFGEAASQHVYTSRFDRTIYFENFSRHACRLITKPPDSAGVDT